jgi:glutathionyl-hydroquinone reductase
MGKRTTLPPGLLVQVGRFTWTSLWQVMMAQLAPPSSKGEYLRPASQFRHSIGTIGAGMADAQPGEEQPQYPAASKRYKLLVGQGCPWAHRTVVVWRLKGLMDAIDLAPVIPAPAQGGWVFAQPEAGCQRLSELYQLSQPGYRGRNTVPVLWDSQTQTIVNNESAEIIVILNQAFNDYAQHPDLDLYPTALKPEIDRWNDLIYESVNNGVYRCGMAQTQTAYNQACAALFSTLDQLEAALTNRVYLCGDSLTLADVRLFTTLIRFDLVYYSLFKCNRRRIKDYPNLWGYLGRIYHLPGIADTCDFEAIKQEYYSNLFPLNPGGIVPMGPDLSELLPASQPQTAPLATPQTPIEH